MRAARVEVAREVAVQVAAEVKSKIPTGGWFSIYRDAIEFFEHDEKAWAVAGLYPSALTKFPAEETQLEFSGESKFAVIMAAQNPWTIDMIPALSGGYPAKATAKHASPSEIAAHRARLTTVISSVRDALLAAGGAIESSGLPRINGQVYADIGFLALRLEHGLGGLPRKPVWLKTWNELRAKIDDWAAVPAPLVKQILSGDSTGATEAKTMPKDLLNAIRRGT
jgi:hypothetical protein